MLGQFRTAVSSARLQSPKEKPMFWQNPTQLSSSIPRTPRRVAMATCRVFFGLWAIILIGSILSASSAEAQIRVLNLGRHNPAAANIDGLGVHFRTERRE